MTIVYLVCNLNEFSYIFVEDFTSIRYENISLYISLYKHHPMSRFYGIDELGLKSTS